MRRFLNFVIQVPRNALIGLIKLYQVTLSPVIHFLFRTNCKFRPTCSEYSVMAIRKYGVLRGIYKGTCRVFRCNPWGKGGLDLP
jgi:uncharacterized protein